MKEEGRHGHVLLVYARVRLYYHLDGRKSEAEATAKRQALCLPAAAGDLYRKENTAALCIENKGVRPLIVGSDPFIFPGLLRFR